jgi:hypothetical protein
VRKRQDTSQLASEFSPLLSFLGLDPNLVYQGAQQLECLPALVGIAKQRSQYVNTGAKDFCQVGMQEWLFLGAVLQGPGQSRLVCVKLLEFGVDWLSVGAIEDGVHQAFDLAVHPFKVALYGGLGGRFL